MNIALISNIAIMVLDNIIILLHSNLYKSYSKTVYNSIQLHISVLHYEKKIQKITYQVYTTLR